MGPRVKVNKADRRAGGQVTFLYTSYLPIFLSSGISGEKIWGKLTPTHYISTATDIMMAKESRQGGLLPLLRSLGLPRKRFLLLGVGSVVLLMYTFVNYSNAALPRVVFSSSSLSSSSAAAGTTCSPAAPPTIPAPPLKDQVGQQADHSLEVPGISASLAGRIHPIPGLMKAAETKWNAMLKSQSTTLAAAAKEYKRRYGLLPPDGFDLWFAYAKGQGVTLVDEYDELMAVLAPLRKLAPQEVRRRAENLLKFGFGESLGGLVVDGPKGEFTFWDPEKMKKKIQKRGGLVVVDGEEPNGGYRTSGLLEMLAPVKEVLRKKMAKWPAFAIPVNELAEARVVGGDDAKWRALTDALVTKKDTYDKEDLWHEHETAGRTLAEDFINACGSDSPYGKKAAGTRFEFGIEEVLGSVGGELKGEGRKAEFVVDPNADNDICQRPELMAVCFFHFSKNRDHGADVKI
jgi:hypothetical protein